ncbi:MAG: STAS domain-containing protein [Terriglobales bacterium]
MLQIQSKQVEPDITVLEIVGKIILGRDCKHLEWTTENLLRDNHKKIIFDLSGVTHIDSTGIGIIVMSAGQVKNAGGQLRVACPEGHVGQVLKMTNVDKVISLHSSATAAAAAF